MTYYKVKEKYIEFGGSHNDEFQSIWSPHMSFILKGSQILALQFQGLVQIQDVNARAQRMKYRTRITLVHELYGTCF